VDRSELDRFVRETKVKDLRALAQERGRRGYVAQANSDGTAGLVKWDQSSKTPDGRYNQQVAGEDRKTEDQLVAKLHEGLPEVKRRTAQERFRVLFERLVQEAMVSYRAHGYPVWPKSIQYKLATLGWKPGDPDVYGQCRALAERLFIEAGQKQQEKDRRKTTLGWHGEYNHAVTARADSEEPSLVSAARAGTPKRKAS